MPNWRTRQTRKAHRHGAKCGLRKCAVISRYCPVTLKGETGYPVLEERRGIPE